MPLSPGSWTQVDPQPSEQTLPPLITAQLVGSWTRGKIPASTPGLELACSGVSETIRDYLGWHLFPVLQIDDLIDGPGGSVLHLPTRYLRSVESIEWRGQALEEGSYRFSTLGYVEHDPHGVGGWPWPSLGSWPVGFRTLHVRFTSGYSNVPASVAQLAVGLVARAAASPLGLTREQAGQVSLGFGGATGAGGGIGLLQSEMTTLDAYRIVGV